MDIINFLINFFVKLYLKEIVIFKNMIVNIVNIQWNVIH